MKAITGLLMVILRVTQAVEIHCDARQGNTQCYGALGGTVALQLVDNFSVIPRYNWKKKARRTNESTQIILNRKTNNLLNLSARYVFIPDNGTLKIINLSRSDSANYTLETFSDTGKKLKESNLHLTIQAPVTSMHLISECMPQGLFKASCISEGGDSLGYTWILNGSTAGDAEILYRDPDKNIIILRRNVTGYLVCSVGNNITHISEERRISLCKDEETYCNIEEDGTICYGALGGTVVIHLMNNTSETPKYAWKNKTLTILRGNGDRFFQNDIEGRCLFIPTYGTFSIMNLSRADSGEYSLETFDSDGRNTRKKTLQLIVEAPVSSVKLDSECLSQGEMRVSCLSEGGDNMQYSWTLNGHTLTDSELFSDYSKINIIVLRQNISGRLICSVWNRFSSLSREKTISTCGFIFINCTFNGTETSGWVFADDNILCVEPAYAYSVADMLKVLGSLLSALVLLSAVGIGFICAQKKKYSFKEQNNSEPVYAEVREVRKHERQTEERLEEDAENNPVTLSEIPQQSMPSPVYAQVCKVR